MEDMEKETVDFIPNYDETRTEPTVFPAAFPNLLVKVYSDAARTVLVTTVDVVLHLDNTYRYFYALRTHAVADIPATFVGFGANYDVGVAYPPEPPPDPAP